MTGKHWTQDELTYLEYFVKENDAELKDAADFLGRSVDSLKKKLWRLRKENGSVQHMHKLWSEKDDDFLRAYYPTLLNKNIAKRLNRTVGAVEIRAAKLGLSKQKKIQIHDSEIRKLISEGYYLSQVCKVLNIKMSSLIAHCKREEIEYEKMPRKKHANYGNHIWNRQDQARYKEYLHNK